MYVVWLRVEIGQLSTSIKICLFVPWNCWRLLCVCPDFRAGEPRSESRERASRSCPSPCGGWTPCSLKAYISNLKSRRTLHWLIYWCKSFILESSLNLCCFFSTDHRQHETWRIKSCELSTLIQSAVGPVSEPVEDASIEEGRRGGGSVLEAVGRRVHREHHVKIFHYLKMFRKKSKVEWRIIKLGRLLLLKILQIKIVTKKVDFP